MVDLRPATTEDAAAWAAVVLAASPHFVIDEASAAHVLRTYPGDHFVAQQGGVVVGIARCQRHPDTGHALLQLMVLPEHRRRGVGRALLEHVLSFLAGSPIRRLDALLEDDDASRAAAEAWGFRVVRRFRNWVLDPREAGPAGPTPEGYTVTTTAELGPEPVWRAHQRVASEDPSGLTLPIAYDAWLDEWEDPRARHGWSHALLAADGSLASYTLIGAAGDRAWSNMTGTLPEHRGRGLALLCKQHTLRVAAGHGITRCFTGNDAANVSMLAVNGRLGYRLLAQPSLVTRDLR